MPNPTNRAAILGRPVAADQPSLPVPERAARLGPPVAVPTPTNAPVQGSPIEGASRQPQQPASAPRAPIEINLTPAQSELTLTGKHASLTTGVKTPNFHPTQGYLDVSLEKKQIQPLLTGTAPLNIAAKLRVEEKDFRGAPEVKFRAIVEKGPIKISVGADLPPTGQPSAALRFDADKKW